MKTLQPVTRHLQARGSDTNNKAPMTNPLTEKPVQFKFWNNAIWREPDKIGGQAKVLDVRGWGYLTGNGHGAHGLDQNTAASAQEEFGELVTSLLNQHFQK